MASSTTADRIIEKESMASSRGLRARGPGNAGPRGDERALREQSTCREHHPMCTGTAVVPFTRSSTKLDLQSCTLGWRSRVSPMKRA
jgi:hypothetical protein